MTPRLKTEKAEVQIQSVYNLFAQDKENCQGRRKEKFRRKTVKPKADSHAHLGLYPYSNLANHSRRFTKRIDNARGSINMSAFSRQNRKECQNHIKSAGEEYSGKCLSKEFNTFNFEKT